METTRGDSNRRHERNIVRGTVIIISTVVMYLVNIQFSLFFLILMILLKQNIIKKGGMMHSETGEVLKCHVSLRQSVEEIRLGKE